jgi:hypothetical protein
VCSKSVCCRVRCCIYAASIHMCTTAMCHCFAFVVCVSSSSIVAVVLVCTPYHYDNSHYIHTRTAAMLCQRTAQSLKSELHIYNYRKTVQVLLATVTCISRMLTHYTILLEYAHLYLYTMMVAAPVPSYV